MKKTILTLALLSALLCSCNANPSSTPISSSTESTTTSTATPVTVSKELLESKIYINATTFFTLPTTFFTGYEDIPYVSLEQFYENLMSKGVAEQEGAFQVVEGSVVNTLTGGSLTFSLIENSIRSVDLDSFVNLTGSEKITTDMLGVTSNKLAKLNEEKSSTTTGNAITFKLDKYKMKMISYNNKIYVPFSILECISLSPVFTRFVFNGEDYYMVSTESFIDSKTKELTDFAKAFAQGSIIKKKTRSASFANYFYYSYLFELENYHGHFPRLNIDSLDSKMEELGLKEKLLSTDSDVANEAFAKSLSQIFSDGGHTGFGHRGLTSEYSNETDQELLKKYLLEYDKRLVKEMTAFATLGQLNQDKIEKMPTVEYSTSSSTAVVHFMSFVPHDVLTKENIDQDQTSTFSTFYHAFKEFKDKTNLKNVIFDVSLNGGGAASALGEALSFLTDDPVVMTTTNSLTKSVCKQAIDVDNNLDGNFTDNDSYAGKYNYYILTSEYSFSCANAFPCMAKENGYAKIIGKRSGGGDCAVLPSVTMDGGIFSMSSNYSITRKDGTNVDDGCPVDLEIEYADFFDIDKLETEISKIK